MGRSSPGPLFWQLNHANSDYFGATYQSISTFSPLFFGNPGSDPEYEVKLTNSNLREINTLSNMRVITHSFTPHTHTPPPPHTHTGHSMQSLVWHIMLRAEFGALNVCPPGVYCQRCKTRRNFHFVTSVPCADISTKFYYTTQPKPNGWEAANMYNVTYWIAGFMMYVCMLLKKKKKKDVGRRFPINMVYRE